MNREQIIEYVGNLIHDDEVLAGYCHEMNTFTIHGIDIMTLEEGSVEYNLYWAEYTLILYEIVCTVTSRFSCHSK